MGTKSNFSLGFLGYLLLLGTLTSNGCLSPSATSPSVVILFPEYDEPVMVSKLPRADSSTDLDRVMVLHYGLAYPLFQQRADGSSASGQWVAEKGTIIDNNTYIAPRGQVFLDRDTLSYVPTKEEANKGYQPQKFEIVLGLSIDTDKDSRAQLYHVASQRNLPHLVAVPVVQVGAPGEFKMEERPVFFVPFSEIAIEPLSQTIIVHVEPALAGQYATSGDSLGSLPTVTLSANGRTISCSRLAMSEAGAAQVAPLTLALGAPNIEIRRIPKLMNVSRSQRMHTEWSISYRSAAQEGPLPDGLKKLGSVTIGRSHDLPLDDANQWLGEFGIAGETFDTTGPDVTHHILAFSQFELNSERTVTYLGKSPSKPAQTLLDFSSTRKYQYFTGPFPRVLAYFLREKYQFEGGLMRTQNILVRKTESQSISHIARIDPERE